MKIIDNDITIDDEVHVLMEELLTDFLEEQPVREPFLLSTLYDSLGIKYTKSRAGTLDKLIDQILEAWNWVNFYRGLNIDLRYVVRRTHCYNPKEIKLTCVATVVTGASWPYYIGINAIKRKRRPRDPKVVERISGKLRKARAAADKLRLEKVG